MSIFMNRLKHLFFLSKKIEFFLLIYKDGKPKLWKWEYWEKMLKYNAKEPLCKG